MGGFQLWLMVDIIVATAPLGSPLFVARSHASAKQLPPTKFPFTQATDQMNGHIPLLVRELTLLLENPEELQEFVLPWPV